MKSKKIFYEKTAQNLINNLKKRNIEAFFINSKEEILEKILKIIPENSSICFGGSQSIQQIKLIPFLKSKNFKVFDRNDAKNQDEIDYIYQKAFSADFYISSVNAISLDGEIVNIDGTGNRVAAITYGPKNVILIIGINKICKNLEEAISRAKHFASPINAIRLNKNTPCKNTAKCFECLCEDTICCTTSIIRYSRFKNRIKVILIGEELGF